MYILYCVQYIFLVSEASHYVRHAVCSTMSEYSNMSCESYPTSAVKMVHGAYRLITPIVSRLSSLHFGCQLHADVFGPVLHTLVL